MDFLKTHRRPVIITAVIVAVLAVALFFLLRDRGSRSDAVYVQSVREITGGGLTLVERFSGVAESQKTEKISADSSKTVKEIFVQAGDTVKQGDKLFSYDTELIALTYSRRSWRSSPCRPPWPLPTARSPSISRSARAPPARIGWPTTPRSSSSRRRSTPRTMTSKPSRQSWSVSSRVCRTRRSQPPPTA